MVAKFRSMPIIYQAAIGVVSTLLIASISWATMRIIKIDSIELQVQEIKPSCAQIPAIVSDVNDIQQHSRRMNRDWARLKADIEITKRDAAITRYYVEQWAEKEGIRPPPKLE